MALLLLAAICAAPGTASAAEGQVTITGVYVNILDRIAPRPRSGIESRHEFTIVLSNGKQVTENWNRQSGRTVRRSSSVKILGETGESGGAWRVVSGDKLQRSFDYPQNITLLTVSVSGQSCQLSTEYRLKPGFADYTFRRSRSREWANYDKPRTISTSCVIQ